MSRNGTSKPCPSCGGSMVTKDSRGHVSPEILVRRRVCCTSCGKRYTTHEIIVDDMTQVGAIMVTVAAHDRAQAAVQEALAELISQYDPDQVKQARSTLRLGLRSGAKP